MSAIGQLVDGVFGVKSPTVNVPDYAAQAAVKYRRSPSLVG
jgi:hypothetical protein